MKPNRRPSSFCWSRPTKRWTRAKTLSWNALLKTRKESAGCIWWGVIMRIAVFLSSSLIIIIIQLKIIFFMIISWFLSVFKDGSTRTPLLVFSLGNMSGRIQGSAGDSFIFYSTTFPFILCCQTTFPFLFKVCECFLRRILTRAIGDVRQPPVFPLGRST